MKFLIIIGSPRKKGHCAQAADLIETNIMLQKYNEVEKIFLSDLDFGKCSGCHTCIMNSEEKCPCKEARDLILKKIEESAGIVFITPIYCMHVSYLMKILFDRLAFLWHRPRFFGKKFMTVTVGGGGGPIAKPVHEYIKTNAKRWGAEFFGSLSLLRFDSPMTKRVQKNQSESLKRISIEFSRSINLKNKKPSLSDLIWFNVWRDSAIIDQTGTKADFHYWREKGWLKRGVNYFYPTPINPFSLMVSKFIKFSTRKFMKTVYTSYDEIDELEGNC